MTMIKRALGVHSWLYIFLCVIIATGCKTKKIVEHKGPVPDRTDAEIISAMSEHNHDFDWYNCETGISLKTPEEGVSGKSYIRMKKDSIIWSIVKKLSVEAVRMLATENTYAAINRIEGTYQKGDTGDAFAKMGVTLDFLDMQQAIFGNIILPDESNIVIEKEGKHYVVKGMDGDLQLKYWINAYDLELDRVKMIDYRRRTIEVEYDDYRVLESGEKVPFYRFYKVPFNADGDAEIEMKVKKIEINVPKKTRFTIPSHYDRVY